MQWPLCDAPVRAGTSNTRARPFTFRRVPVSAEGMVPLKFSIHCGLVNEPVWVRLAPPRGEGLSSTATCAAASDSHPLEESNSGFCFWRAACYLYTKGICWVVVANKKGHQLCAGSPESVKKLRSNLVHSRRYHSQFPLVARDTGCRVINPGRHSKRRAQGTFGVLLVLHHGSHIT